MADGVTHLTDRVGERTLLSYRLAVVALFTVFGIVLSTWAVHLPELQKNVGISTTMLGALLLVLGVGAILGMQLSGRVIDRVGPERVGAFSAAVMALTLNGPLAASQWQLAAVGAFVMGVATGVAEVSMNAAAVRVERLYGRPIMASFHGVFSLSNVVGSSISAAGFALGISTLSTTAVVTAVGLLVVAVAWPTLNRSATIEADISPVDEQTAVDSDVPVHRLKLIMLGALAFLFLLAEGSAMDWSSLHAQRELGSSSAVGALAFGAFVGAMTVGRFVVDRIAEAIGPVRVVRYGSALAVMGFATVMAAPTIPVLLAGWILTGLGLAGGVPQIFTAAGNLGSGSARTLSRVVGVGYVAILAGPGLVGWLADLTTLNTALALPLGAALICALTAKAVSR